jgi:ABC-type dipeptide/oligopeptide/nickel transport system permease subunit
VIGTTDTAILIRHILPNMLTVIGFNFLGDGLRDALDPRRVEGKR